MRHRLRDLTAESETDYRRKIADLEKELDLTAELQGGLLQSLCRPSK
jgi:hypothetical protein